MFTGIVRELGEVAEVGDGRLRIFTAMPGEIGASVAVNGACLTIVAAKNQTLAFDTVPETLRRTNLGRLKAGDRVNLEPALTLAQPLDGHLVQGHVDGTAEVLEVSVEAPGKRVTFELPGQLARYVAEKGSIAVDGTSLTVTAVTDRAFAVALIPHTLEHTIAKHYEPGSIVNLEVDVIARYVQRLLPQ